jgi:nucleotide-binding universal stress UspA family protein
MATTSVDGKPYIIVVGVDFSEASELAAHRAFELAAERDPAELHLINVVQTYGPQVAYEMPMDASALTVLTVAEARNRFKTYADQSIARFTEQNPGKRLARVFTHVRFDSVADEVAQLAADLEADLVVVGTHGRRGLSRMLLGSSAEATVRLAPCPVLVVRPKAVPDSPPRIEPPCPDCVTERRETGGAEMWCARHRERHGQRHTYFQRDRTSGDSEMPLIGRQ